MIRPKNSFFILLTALLGIALLTISCDMPPHGHRVGERFDWIAERISSHLDLNESQQKTLDRIKKELVQEARELQKAKLQRLKILSREFPENTLSENKLNQSTTRALEAEKKFELLFIDKIKEFHSVLTEEQRKKLGNKLQSIHARISEKVE